MVDSNNNNSSAFEGAERRRAQRRLNDPERREMMRPEPAEPGRRKLYGRRKDDTPWRLPAKRASESNVR